MIPKFTPFLFLLAIATFSAPAAFGNGTVTYGNRHVALAADFQGAMQCVLNRIQQAGYTPRDVGCFGYRPGNASAHPTGHACDVDQTGRNLTSLNRPFPPRSGEQQSFASSCHAVSGCIWRHPDCGHFEAFSAPYSPAGTPVGGGARRIHYYGESYASHPVMRHRHRRHRGKR